MIKQYTQGETTDNELYCAVGRWAISSEVHDKLGLAITGRDYDIWHISFDGDYPNGFSQLRILKNGKGHIRYLYTQSAKIDGLLIKAEIATARELGVKVLFTNDRETATIWKQFGFQLKKSHHGSFGRWERELK